MNISFYLPLILFCVSSSITPGPNNLMIMMSSLHFGLRRSLPHFLGICIGFTILILCVGLGLAFIFSDYPEAHWIVKIIGATYILWLAWKIISASTKLSEESKKKPLSFLQAVLFQWVNPKAWVMAIGATSTYTSVNSGFSMNTQILIIALIYFLTVLPCTGAWMLGGHTFKKILTNEAHQRIFNLVLGLLLVISIIIMLYE